MPPVPTPVIKISSPATKEFWEISVLYEDSELLVLDKPSGLLVSPDRYDAERPNLMGLLHRDIARGAPWAAQRSLTYLSNAHRLDFETSGILLLCRSKSSLVHLANQFGANTPQKEYVALVQGQPAEDEWTVNERIAPFPGRPGHMRVDPKRGKNSRTQFQVLERFHGYSWVSCHPFTGRTHQIRVHLAFHRHPIVGDRIYGGRPLLLSKLKPGYRLKPDRTERPLLERVSLHAKRLTIQHPVSGESVSIESPLPKDLRVALKYLRMFAAGPAPASAPEADDSEMVGGNRFDKSDGDDGGADQQEST